LILCLPGESKASFMKSVSDLLDAGVKRISAHQLMLLHGAPLSTAESRSRYRFDTRFRVVARNIGNYLGEPIVEVEEIVVATPDFSFQDYLDTRVFHLLLTIFYYEGNFEEAFELAQQEGIRPFDLVCRLQSMLNQAPAGIRQLTADFVRESNQELFATHDDCIAWSRRNFDGLVDGTVGGNLLSKYSMAGRFYLTQEAVTFLQGAIAAALANRGAPAQEQLLEDVAGYLRAVLLQAPFSQSVVSAPAWLSHFDVEAWRNDKYARRLESYRRSEPITYNATVDPELRATIESRIAAFGEHPSQLGKFTRTMFAQDLRRQLALPRKVPYEGPEAPA
jgi:heme-degrading monooxygenase HmoA